MEKAGHAMLHENRAKFHGAFPSFRPAYHGRCNVRLMVEKDLRHNLTNHEAGFADAEKPHGQGGRQVGSPGARCPAAALLLEDLRVSEGTSAMRRMPPPGAFASRRQERCLKQ
jgi:hypothetical protein